MPINIPIRIIPIENDGFHLLVKIKINDRIATMIIDTGASRTVFDEELILKYLKVEESTFEENEKLSTGLGTNSMKSKAIELKSIKFGNLKIKNYQAIVLDLKHVNESYKMLKLPIIHGVLGGDLLNKYKAVIYYKTKILKLYP